MLGSILIDRDAIIEVADFLKPEDFYRQAHGRIYAAMLDLSERREPIDVVTVAEALERTGDLEAIGGRAYLGTLSNQTPTAVHAAQYARIVERKAVLRNLISAAGKIAGIGYEDPAEVQEAIDRAEAELFAVSQRRIAAGFSAAQEPPPRRLRPAGLPPRAPRRDQRRPHRLPGPGHAHHGPPEERPRSSSPPARPSARRASRSTSPSTPRCGSARPSASSASR